MFSHIYKYRLKCILRDRQIIFWTMAFPLILATLFHMTIANITSSETFSEVKIAFSEEGGSQEYRLLKETLEQMSAGEGRNGGKKLLDVTYTSRGEADSLLKDGKIKGYICYDGEIKLVVKDRGLEQTVLKGILDDFRQSISSVTAILEENPAAANGSLFDDIAKRADYLIESAAGKAAPNTSVHYFYTLIAMMCFYGGFHGLKEVMSVQANQSSAGARVNMAPTRKMKVFLVSILAAVTVQLIETALLLLYLAFVLRVDFGNRIAYVLITCVAGSFTGVSFGACIAATMKTGEGPKIAVVISVSMIMSFFSGMMYHGIKTIVRSKAPVLSYLNPLNLIADSFYSLYYYQTYTRYFTNLALLCGFFALFSMFTYLAVRRRKYASL